MAYNPDQTLRRLEWLRRLRNQPLFALATVIVVVGAAAAARIYFPYAPQLIFATFFPAVALCTVFGGIRGGLLALVLSLIAADFWLLGPGHWLPAAPQDQAAMIAFAGSAVLIILAVSLLNRVNDRLGDETAKVQALHERGDVLSREVSHRARNLLTLVQAIARKSLPSDQAERFGKVLEALSRTQDIFAASQAVTLAQLLESELAGFPDQVTIQGCKLTLAPRAAQAFALIVHELSANALKHGALSTADGRVRIAGTATGDGRFVFLWQESEGPEPKSAVEPGFGQTILNDLARSFASNVDIDLDGGGLRYRLEARLDRIADASELAGETGETRP
ncbi:MAG: sensor histidine kinase [Sphingosinicella sp.]